MALGILTGTAVFGLASMYFSRHEHDDRGVPIAAIPAFLAVKLFEPLLPPNPNDV